MPAPRAVQDPRADSDRAVRSDIQTAGLCDDRSLDLVPAAALADQLVSESGDGTATIGLESKFRCRGPDDRFNRAIAILPAVVSLVLGLRQHQPAQHGAGGTRIEAAADVASGECAQLRMITVAGDYPPDQFGVGSSGSHLTEDSHLRFCTVWFCATLGNAQRNIHSGD